MHNPTLANPAFPVRTGFGVAGQLEFAVPAKAVPLRKFEVFRHSKIPSRAYLIPVRTGKAGFARVGLRIFGGVPEVIFPTGF